MTTQRRKFLAQSALSSVSAVALASCRQQTASVKTEASDSHTAIQWRMATSWPKQLDILFGGAEQLCSRVKEITQGKFLITPYPSGEIAPGLEVLDVVAAGEVECGHTASYYYTDKEPVLAFGTTVPFGLTSNQQNAWLYYGGGLEAIQSIYKKFGVINFPAGNTGVQMGGWFRKQIQHPQDLKQLKMRIPGLGGKVMQRLGVDVQVLSADAIASALLAGEIDAAEWNNPYDDEKIGIAKAAPYCYYPGWWEPGATYELQVNLEKWNALPASFQEVLKVAAAEVNVAMSANYNAKNGLAIERIQQNGTQVIPFSHNILEAAYRETLALYEEYATAEPFQSIYRQWLQFREEIYSWNRINLLSFDQFVMNPSI